MQLVLKFLYFLMKDALLVSSSFTEIPFWTPPFLCMDWCFLQMMDLFSLSDTLLVVFLAPIT